MLGDASTLAELHGSTWREARAHLLTDEFFSEEYLVHVAARLTDPFPGGYRRSWFGARCRSGAHSHGGSYPVRCRVMQSLRPQRGRVRHLWEDGDDKMRDSTDQLVTCPTPR